MESAARGKSAWRTVTGDKGQSSAVPLPTLLRVLAVVVLTGLSYGLMTWAWSGLHVNSVIINYIRAGIYFGQGLDPYVETLRFGASNQFKYSPLFAMAVAPLRHVAPSAVLHLWVLSGAVVFWWGVVRWVPLTWRPWWGLTVALLACAVELTTSLGIYQINAVIVGLTLLGLAECRDGRGASGGALLMLATNLKVFPVIFLLAGVRRGGWQYLVGATATGLVSFLLPALVVGLQANLELHLSWLSQITHDTVGAGILDVSSALARVGAPRLGCVMWWAIFWTALLLFGLVAAQRQALGTAWGAWISLGLCAFVLLSPRTEVATFVVVGPVYVLLVVTLVDLQAWRPKAVALLALGVAMYLVSWHSNPLNDRNFVVSELPARGWRVSGTLILFVLAATWLSAYMDTHWQVRARVQNVMRSLLRPRHS